MKVTINNKDYFVTIAKTKVYNEIIKSGADYQCTAKDQTGNTVGAIKFYFDKMEPIVQLERFKTNDFDSTNALFTAIRVFCHNNQSMLIEVSDISDKINKDLLINNKEEYSKFKEFLDSLEPQENAFEIDKSEPDFGYSVALFDEEDALSKVDGYSVQDDTELCK